ncbi:MAG TPA: type I restriction-modification enzyme R subunit C-terminal domain-containing protein [Mycobacterium sp.]|nr:type I restriction-modification enzyme R subunit C-terminal domain-containing protein [Mycobacterium sp.]
MIGPPLLLDGTRFTAEQIRFINLIVNELTANGVMEPARLYESPYTNHGPTGPEVVFLETEVDGIVDILDTVRAIPSRTSRKSSVPSRRATPRPNPVKF